VAAEGPRGEVGDLAALHVLGQGPEEAAEAESRDFGDDETSTEENPVHTYTEDGYYTVSLTVTDDEGNSSTYTRDDYIYVTPGWNAGSVAGSAWNGLVVFGRVIANVFIWIGVFFPIWIVIGAIVIGIIFWRRRKNRKTGM
jgi:hypothetical protein